MPCKMHPSADTVAYPSLRPASLIQFDGYRFSVLLHDDPLKPVGYPVYVRMYVLHMYTCIDTLVLFIIIYTMRGNTILVSVIFLSNDVRAYSD